ncbi:MAG: peptidoglycan editing factor PgeF [Nitrospina sp.]|nr:peptidoglycan editing factor PgeF [Nitrospina sp.]
MFKKFKFNQFETFSELIHAVSPRCFTNEQGETEEFSFRGKDEFGKTNFHVELFLESIGIANNKLFLVNQIHSDKIFILDDASLASSEAVKVSADALLTHLPGKPLGIFTADCLPVLIYDPRLKVIGAIHAGRKGSEQSIILKVVREMGRVYGSRPEELLAGIGPAIGGCCYEVDEDCIQPFMKMFPDKIDWFREGLPGKYFLNLMAVNKMQGEHAGLLRGNIFSMDHCTCCSTQNLFSYRREGKTGRILTTIMLRP